MFGFGGVIARRVNAVMKQRVADAQAKYDLESKSIDEKADVKIQDVKTEAEMKRKKTQDNLVQEIIGK